MNIAQMFCYDKMLEGSHFFLENAKRHGHLQTQLAEQTLAKLKEDLTEQKEERRKDHESLNNKLRAAETQKAELAAREESIRESLA